MVIQLNEHLTIMVDFKIRDIDHPEHDWESQLKTASTQEAADEAEVWLEKFTAMLRRYS